MFSVVLNFSPHPQNITFYSQLNWIGYKQFRQRKVFFVLCVQVVKWKKTNSNFQSHSKQLSSFLALLYYNRIIES